MSTSNTKQVIVISLGGSILVPKNGIDTVFLKSFYKLIQREIKKEKRFIIVVGGGSIARQYQQSANQLVSLANEDIDWLGIHATRLNAQLLRTIFASQAKHLVIKNPLRKVEWKESVLIAAGWKPGWSTDYVATRLATKYNSDTVINLSNITQVYDRDPARFEDAIPLSKMLWKDFVKLVGSKWSPGLNSPFDPIASKYAQKHNLKVIVANGKDLNNLQNIIDQKKFIGTIIANQ